MRSLTRGCPMLDLCTAVPLQRELVLGPSVLSCPAEAPSAISAALVACSSQEAGNTYDDEAADAAKRCTTVVCVSTTKLDQGCKPLDLCLIAFLGLDCRQPAVCRLCPVACAVGGIVHIPGSNGHPWGLCMCMCHPCHVLCNQNLSTHSLAANRKHQGNRAPKQSMHFSLCTAKMVLLSNLREGKGATTGIEADEEAAAAKLAMSYDFLAFTPVKSAVMTLHSAV